MNLDRWQEHRSRLLARWPGLSEEDIEATKGERGALVALLEARLGYAPANAEADLDRILQGPPLVAYDVADEQHHTGSSGPVVGAYVPGQVDSPSRAVGGYAAPGTEEFDDLRREQSAPRAPEVEGMRGSIAGTHKADAAGMLGRLNELRRHNSVVGAEWFVRDHPLASIAFAVGVGLMLGRVSR